MSLMSVPESLHFSSCFVLALFAERFGFGKRRENQHLARRLSCPNVLRLLLPLHVIMFSFASRQGSLSNLAEWASASYFSLVPDSAAQ